MYFIFNVHSTLVNFPSSHHGAFSAIVEGERVLLKTCHQNQYQVSYYCHTMY